MIRRQHHLPSHPPALYPNVTLRTAEPHSCTIPNIRHWGRRDQRKFRTHFLRLMKNLLPVRVRVSPWTNSLKVLCKKHFPGKIRCC